MKRRTIKLLAGYLKNGGLYFPENKGPICEMSLTKGKIRDIITGEYGIKSKKTRIQRKYMKKAMDELLRLVVLGINAEKIGLFDD